MRFHFFKMKGRKKPTSNNTLINNPSTKSKFVVGDFPSNQASSKSPAMAIKPTAQSQTALISRQLNVRGWLAASFLGALFLHCAIANISPETLEMTAAIPRRILSGLNSVVAIISLLAAVGLLAASINQLHQNRKPQSGGAA